MSDVRFALITTLILTLAYITALSVSSLDRVLAFVGSTGSTSISFILPGLFYYKISDPESIHHQRLAKEDDDMGGSDESDTEDSGTLAQSSHSIRSTASAASNRSRSAWRSRRKWRWDLEHVDHSLLRKMSLAIAIYGMIVMAVCLTMNVFFAVAH
jgi:amino acid permease